MKITWKCLALALAWPAGLATGAETTSVPFLSLDVSARAAALGGAYAAVVNDASAIVANPAALTRLKTPSVAFMHATYIDSSYFDFMGIGGRMGPKGAYGIGFQYFSAGAIPRTDGSGTTVGEISPKDLAVTAGYAHGLGPVSLGVSAKYIRSELVNVGSAATFDAALLSPPLMNRKLRLAATGSNLGGEITYDKESQPLPTRYRGSAAYTLTKQWGLVADVVFPKAGDTFVAAGMEYQLPMGGPWGMALRGGYNNQSSDLDGMSGLAGGLGFLYDRLGLDYAFVSLGDAGVSHRISFVYSFPAPKPPPKPAAVQKPAAPAKKPAAPEKPKTGTKSPTTKPIKLK